MKAINTSFSFSLVALLLVFSSCTTKQYVGVATGSALGGMLGSSIGGIMSGPRGSDKGTLAGMVVGGIVGAAVTAEQSQTPSSSSKSTTSKNVSSEIEYGTYSHDVSLTSDLDYIEVTNVCFLDTNDNQCLDPSEEAYIEMEIYNRSDNTLYNLTPQIVCSNSKVRFSTPATVSSIPSGSGVRYKSAVIAPKHLSEESLQFTVCFSSGSSTVEAKTFNIRTR